MVCTKGDFFVTLYRMPMEFMHKFTIYYVLFASAVTAIPLITFIDIFIYRMPNEIATVDFNDTFLNLDHLRASFPEHEIRVQTDDPKKVVRPFR
jgi:hypothetical protein